MRTPLITLSSVLASAVAIAVLAFPIGFGKTVIDSGWSPLQRVASVHPARLDGDDDIDLVVAVPDFGAGTDRVLWYENDGNQNFTASTIDSTASNPGAVAVANIDDDSDVDIVVGSTTSSGALFLYTNDGSANFTRTPVDTPLTTIRNIVVVDLDTDTDEDIVITKNDGVFWYENDGSESFTQHTVRNLPMTDTGLQVLDLDFDGDQDIVTSVVDTAIVTNRWLVWYENVGSEIFARNVFDVHTATITDIQVADIDKDGDIDVVTTEFETNTIYWYEDQGGQFFVGHIVGFDFNQTPRGVRVTDIDNDSDNDIVVVGGNSAIGEVVYYENDGFENFTKQTIDGTAGNRQYVAVVDIDQNSLDDLFVANAFPHELLMYQNVGTGTGVGPSFVPSAVLEQNYPNPFNPTTTIEFTVARAAFTNLEVVAADGRRVRTLIARRMGEGAHSTVWNGRDNSGNPVASGVYFSVLKVGSNEVSRKMVLLK